ncbi:MAG: BlaI/MecI/CopY family transcriptional regulator [Bacteroidaceae bacterium]|nr:BlaI/MecI/CopY family transcriptional regulator [Bacteroidaceae bacterium]
MKSLTNREEELMKLFWEKGPLFVKEIIPLLDDPKPHFNTISTIVRGLESKGYVSHEAFGNTHRYFAAVSESDYGKKTLGSVVNRYFGSSYLNAVSSLVKEEKISIDELKSLIEFVEKQGK